MTVKVPVAAPVGVPEMFPFAALSESPAGRLPVVMPYEYEPVPPVACTVCEYAEPTAAAGSVAGLTAMPAAIVTLYARAPLEPLPSVAVTVKELVAAPVGVPESTPLAGLSVRPDGRTPAPTL